ncbi:MAG: ABC transporter permease [Micrococcales bacterium]|nr:ABC transporter permease [Micrococcales bacterium]
MARSVAHYRRRMVRGDVRASWTQFVAVFAMALMSVAAYTGLEGAWNGLRTNLDHFAADSSMADLWLTATHLSADDAARLAAIPGVSAVELRTTATARLDVGDHEVWLDVVVVDKHWKVSRPTAISGRPLNPRGEGVWLDDRLAQAHQLDPDDQVRLVAAADAGSFPLAGTVISPDRVFNIRAPDLTMPDPQRYGYGYVTPEVAAQLFGTELPATLALLRVDGDLATVEGLVRAQAGDALVSLDNRGTKPTVATAFDRVDTIRNLSLLFSALFVLVAVLAMYTSIRRLVDAQAKQIATLRALGFSRGELVRHFSTFGLVAGGAGVVAGLAVAPALSFAVLRSQKPQFDLPAWSLAYTAFPLAVAALVMVSCLAGAALAARSCTQGEPAELLRPGVPMTSRGTKSGSGGLWRTWSYPARWAIRDAMGNPVRLFMGVAGVVGSMMLLFAGFGLPDTISGGAEAAYSPSKAPYTARVDFVFGTPAAAVAELPLGGSAQLVMQLSVPTVDHQRTTVTVVGPGRRFPVPSATGAPADQRGVRVTQAVADRLGLAPGDEARLVLPLGLGEARLPVVDVTDRTSPQGFVIDLETWTAAGLPFVATSALVGDDAQLADLAASPYVSFVVDRDTQRDNALSLMEALRGIFMVLRVFAVVLTVVVLYSLGSLTFDERRRQYATLKVLGLRNDELRRLSIVDNAGVTLFGLALGVPGGLWFLSAYVTQFNTMFVTYDVRITTVSVVIALALTSVVSSLTTLLLGRRIGRVDVVEALKGVD